MRTFSTRGNGILAFFQTAEMGSLLSSSSVTLCQHVGLQLVEGSRAEGEPAEGLSRKSVR